MAEAYIVAATRTAGGRKGGKLKDWHPADLGAAALNDLVGRAGVDPAAIEDVVMGCVMQVGEQAANVGRNAVCSPGLRRKKRIRERELVAFTSRGVSRHRKGRCLCRSHVGAGLSDLRSARRGRRGIRANLKGRPKNPKFGGADSR